MRSLDFFFMLVVSAVTALLYQLGYTSWAIFTGGVFFLILATVTIHYLSAPLPRFIINGMLGNPEEELESTEESKEE